MSCREPGENHSANSGWISQIHRTAVILLLLVTSIAALGETANEVVEKLDAAMRREIAANPQKNQIPRADSALYERRLMIPAQLRLAIEHAPDGRPMDSIFIEIAASFQSTEVQKLASALRETLRKKQEAKDAAELARITNLVERASETLRAAKEPRELDALLREMATDETRRDNGTDAGRLAYYKLQGARQQVARWQDYLAGAQAGNWKRASEILHGMAESADTKVNVIPRSEILALVEKANAHPSPAKQAPLPDRTDEILARAKTMSDIAGVLDELRAYQRQKEPITYAPTDPTVMAINALAPLEKTYRGFMAGLPTSIESTFFESNRVGVPSPELRVELLLTILPRYLGLPEDLKPQSAETVEAFLDRVISTARETGNIALIDRTRELRRMLKGTGERMPDRSGVVSFQAGRNQETAGQYELAVASYQSALKQGGEDLSPRLIGERLAFIKSAHPQEYEKGLEYFLRPPREYRPINAQPYPTRNRPNFGSPDPRVTPTPTGSPQPSISSTPSQTSSR